MSQFNKLREDFEYNVRVVEGRDRELKRYEDYVTVLEGKVRDGAEEVRGRTKREFTTSTQRAHLATNTTVIMHLS